MLAKTPSWTWRQGFRSDLSGIPGGIMHTESDVETGPLFVIEALADLYHLLENYAPSWYRKEHHEKAAAALSAVKAE
jgi:hypothetical protein